MTFFDFFFWIPIQIPSNPPLNPFFLCDDLVHHPPDSITKALGFVFCGVFFNGLYHIAI